MGKSTTSQTLKADPALRSRGLGMYDAASGYQSGPSTPPGGSFLSGVFSRMGLGQQGGQGAYPGVGPISTEMTDDEQAARAGVRSMTDIPSIFTGNIGTYMNPYTQSVIDTTMSDLDRARQMANVDAAGYATRAGAFGGDRATLLEAENNRNFMDSAARSSAQLRSAGFDQASQNLFQGLGLQNAAYGNLANLGMQERMIPMQYYDFLSGLLSRIPGNQTQTQTQNGSLLGGIAGLGATLGGAWLGRPNG